MKSRTTRLPLTATSTVLSMLIGVTVSSVAWGANVNNMVGNANYTYACNEGGPGYGNVCRTDNATLTYYMDSSGAYELETPDRDDVRYTMANDFNPTDLTVSYDTTPTFSGSAETDVIYQEGKVSNGFTGYTWCNDDSPSAKYDCDQTYVRIRGAGRYTRGLSCHETGHAVGLLHGDDANPRTSTSDPDLGCMRNSPPSTASLGTNQRNRINNVY